MLQAARFSPLLVQVPQRAQVQLGLGAFQIKLGICPSSLVNDVAACSERSGTVWYSIPPGPLFKRLDLPRFWLQDLLIGEVHCLCFLGFECLIFPYQQPPAVTLSHPHDSSFLCSNSRREVT